MTLWEGRALIVMMPSKLGLTDTYAILTEFGITFGEGVDPESGYT